MLSRDEKKSCVSNLLTVIRTLKWPSPPTGKYDLFHGKYIFTSGIETVRRGEPRN